MPGSADHNVYCDFNCKGCEEKRCLESVLARMHIFIDSSERLTQRTDIYDSIQSSERAPNLFHIHFAIVSIVHKRTSNSGRIVLATFGPNHPLVLPARTRGSSHWFVDRSAAAAAGTSWSLGKMSGRGPTGVML